MFKSTKSKSTVLATRPKRSLTARSSSLTSKPTSLTRGSKTMTKPSAPIRASRAPFKRSTAPASATKNLRNLHPLGNLHQVFLNELNDLLSGENQILDHLPKLAAMATNQKLKAALLHHLQETKMHVTRLKKIFKVLHETPKNHTCTGMAGILEEGATLLSKAIKGPTKDACIIAAAQRVEHYEMCTYGTARAHALQLDLTEVAHILKEIFEEEIGADKSLSKLAEGSFFTKGINKQALEDEKKLALSKR